MFGSFNKEIIHNKQVKDILLALHSPTLDWSDFVLLASMLLKTILGDTVEEELLNVQNLYLNNEREKVIRSIFKICATYNKINDDPKIINLLNTALVNLDDEKSGHVSRRYFETIFSQSIWFFIDIEEFKCLEKLCVFMKAHNSEINFPDAVTQISDAQDVFISMRQFSEETKLIAAESEKLRQMSLVYSWKDRGPKRSETVFSVNPGIMRSSDPNPLDMRIAEASNRVVDIFVKDAKKQGYSNTRTDIPFVNSISGTAFAFIAVLIHYFNYYSKDSLETKQDELNLFIKSFVSFTCKQGYHSHAEIFEVFKDDALKKLFQKKGLNINFLFAIDSLTLSFENAAKHAVTLCLKRAGHYEMKTHRLLSPKNENPFLIYHYLELPIDYSSIKFRS
jgi:hypothetical protein